MRNLHVAMFVSTSGISLSKDFFVVFIPLYPPDDRFDFTASPEIDFSASLKCSSPACRFF